MKKSKLLEEISKLKSSAGCARMFRMKRLSALLVLGALSALAADPDPSIHCIRFDGNQYVDTGVPARTGVKIELVAEWANPNADSGVFGARIGDIRFYPVHVYEGRLAYGAGGFNKISGARIAANTVYTVVADFADDVQTISLDGTTVWSGTAATGISLPDTTLYLGAVNYGGAKYNCSMTVRSARIWLDGELVHDYAPDFRDGVAGFCDAVDGSFVPSSSSQAFSAVPRWTAGAPDAYVEWVAGSVYTHGIDTLVPARSPLTFEGRMRWTTVDARFGGNEYNYLGAYRTQQNYLAPVHVVTNQLWLAYGNGNDYGTHKFFLTHANGTPATVTAGTDHTFRAVMANGEQTLVWDGETLHSGTLAQDVDFDDDIAVFAAGSWGGLSHHAGARCYWLKIWRGDTLVRDLVPAVKNGEGVLYDRVENLCLYSWAPIGANNIGPALAAPTKPVRFCEYVGSTGTQYIDTGVEGRAGTKVEATMAWVAQTGDEGVIGARKDWGDTRFYPIHYYGDLCYGYGAFNHSPNKSFKIPVGERHVIVADFAAGSQTVTVDGTTVMGGTSSADIRTGRPMYLYAENVVGNADYFSKVRIYELKIWQDGALVRHYVPVLADNGAPYLWDKVSNTFAVSQTDYAFWDFGEPGEPFERPMMILVK